MSQMSKVLLVLLQLISLNHASIWSNAIVSICGNSNLTLSADNPCMYRLFSLSLAWENCHVSANSSVLKEDFTTCFSSCITENQCKPMCPNVGFKKAECVRQCKAFSTCLSQASTLGFANEAEAVNCLIPFVPVNASTAGATGTFLQRLRQKKLIMSFRSPAFLQQEPDDFEADENSTLASFNPDCSCSESGVVDGIDTGKKGCAQHGKEKKAFGQYCYVTGGSKCERAIKSSRIEGAYFVSCFDPTTDYKLMFPESCQLNMQRKEARDVIHISAALSSGEELAKNVSKVISNARAPSSKAEKKAKALLGVFEAWKNPLPPGFLKKHKGLENPEATAKAAQEKLPPVLKGEGAMMAEETPEITFWTSNRTARLLRRHQAQI